MSPNTFNSLLEYVHSLNRAVPPDPGTSSAPWPFYKTGNKQPVELMDYINTLESTLQIRQKTSTPYAAR